MFLLHSKIYNILHSLTFYLLTIKNKYSRYYDDDRYSDHRSLHRSVSHPSLARSESEFIEQWIAPIESPDASPQMQRVQRVLVSFRHQIFTLNSAVLRTIKNHKCKFFLFPTIIDYFPTSTNDIVNGKRKRSTHCYI